ncbi:zf-HC2 domain-containing protein [Streptomyces sp. M19]
MLDGAEAGRFEEHLAECGRCAAELDQLTGLAPVLAEYAAAADGARSRTPGSWPPGPARACWTGCSTR